MLTIYAVASRCHWQYLCTFRTMSSKCSFTFPRISLMQCVIKHGSLESIWSGSRLSSLYYSLTPLPSSPHSSPHLHSLLSPPFRTPPLSSLSPPLCSPLFSSPPLHSPTITSLTPLLCTHLIFSPSPPLPLFPPLVSFHSPTLSFLLPFDLLLSTLMQSRLHLRCPSS